MGICCLFVIVAVFETQIIELRERQLSWNEEDRCFGPANYQVTNELNSRFKLGNYREFNLNDAVTVELRSGQLLLGEILKSSGSEIELDVGVTKLRISRDKIKKIKKYDDAAFPYKENQD